MQKKILTLVVVVEVKAEKKEFVKNEMEKLVIESRKEGGCIDYTIHEDIENENRFVFYENWKSTEDWQMHESTKHFQEYCHVTEGFIDIVSRYSLSKIEY
ncbi:MAG: putative quinol monooxygenase [Spirochaetales bacterium]